ncbi:MAG: LAGLIDADG family homing endonuclease, partial [bacterium]
MSTTVSRETSSKSTPSLDFIAGVVETHGCFFWQKTGKRATPFFRIKIHRAQAPLLSSISTKLGLCGNIYRYSHGGRKYAMLVVRRRSEIADKLIPALDGRLLGSKRKEYEK